MAVIDAEDVIPPPQNLAEVGIHMSYMRADIRGLSKTLREGLQELGEHFVSKESFKPVAEAAAKHEDRLTVLEAFMNTLNGKMIGFGFGISVATSVLTFALTHLWN